MWRKLAEMTSPSSTIRPLTQVFPHSSLDSSTIPHSLTLAWTLTVRDTNTPLFTLKDRVSQNLLVTQTVLDNIHWTWNANLRLEMRVVHSFWDNKWLSHMTTTSSLFFIYLSPHRLMLSAAAASVGQDDPYVSLLRDRAPMRHESGWILSPCPSPPPFSLHRLNGVWGYHTRWLQR